MEKYNQLKENVSHYVGSIKQVVNFSQHYSTDNDYIISGYRINYNTPWLTIKSLFHRHNELLNIWTHVIGALLALLMIMQILIYADHHQRQKLTSDIDQIFSLSPINDETIEKIDYNSTYHTILNRIEFIENQVITSEHYKELVGLISNTTVLLKSLGPEQQFFSDSVDLLQGKLFSIKNKIIQQVQFDQYYQIDSEEFDWLEIYKYSYSHASIIRQEQIYRKVADPMHISRWPIVVFLISAILCMFGSAMFHLFYQMSAKANKYLLRVDYGGISLLVLGSTFPPFFYGFYCENFLKYFYLFLIGSACLAAYVVSIFDFIHTERWRKVKGFMYGSLGLFAGVPAMHLYLREFYEVADSDYLPFKHSFIYYVLMGTSYLGGLALYVFRIPERFGPGKFDLIGHSHQIWHICVFLGVVFSYVGAIHNLADRRFTFCII